MGGRTFKIRRQRSANLFEDFIEAEGARPQAGVFFYDIEMLSTSGLAGEFVIPPERSEIVIRPAIFYRLLGALLLLLGSYLWWFTFRIFIHSLFPAPVGLVCLVVASAAVAATLLYFFLSKNNNYTLRMETSGISFRRNHIAWTEIKETAIMWKRGRKVRRTYLVVFERNGSAQKLKLGMFDISEDWLAAVVEQYKNQKELKCIT